MMSTQSSVEKRNTIMQHTFRMEKKGDEMKVKLSFRFSYWGAEKEKKIWRYMKKLPVATWKLMHINFNFILILTTIHL